MSVCCGLHAGKEGERTRKQKYWICNIMMSANMQPVRLVLGDLCMAADFYPMFHVLHPPSLLQPRNA
jgi:hypothetical protein